MTKNDLFRLLSLLVQGHAFSEDKHKQLQSFCVIRGRGEINGDSLGRSVVDRFKPYFYSRRWAAQGYTSNAIEYDFPAVFAIELPGTIEGGPSNTRAQMCADIQLICLYPNIEHLEDTLAARCKALSVQEIEQQTLAHLVYLFQNVGSSAVFATTNKDTQGSWYLQQELDYLLDQGEIVAMAVDQGKTNAWRKRFEESNRQVSFDYVDDFTAHKLCGASLTIRNCEALCASASAPAFTNINCCAQR
ncbi:hypothetical protein KC887_00565 [Candidatus Kaiserbacteria bacterium]|nr:hypothetical protein [Candidatus Kaiserbacteria bacterium]